jgi:predicted amidophosphoribosyltransferase
MSIAFLALLFPQKCAFCGKLTAAKEQGCCRSCRRTLPYTDGILRLSHSAALLRCAAPLYYTGSVRSAVLRLKFGGRPELARAFAVIVADETIRAFGAEFDLVTWVPVSAARLRERGFDQAKLIAEYAARRLGLKAVQLLIKTQDRYPRAVDAAPLRRRGYQCLSGQFVSYENADQGDQSAELFIQYGRL